MLSYTAAKQRNSEALHPISLVLAAVFCIEWWSDVSGGKHEACLDHCLYRMRDRLAARGGLSMFTQVGE
jgi:hypothetical protein